MHSPSLWLPGYNSDMKWGGSFIPSGRMMCLLDSWLLGFGTENLACLACLCYYKSRDVPTCPKWPLEELIMFCNHHRDLYCLHLGPGVV